MALRLERHFLFSLSCLNPIFYTSQLSLNGILHELDASIDFVSGFVLFLIQI